MWLELCSFHPKPSLAWAPEKWYIFPILHLYKFLRALASTLLNAKEPIRFQPSYTTGSFSTLETAVFSLCLGTATVKLLSTSALCISLHPKPSASSIFLSYFLENEECGGWLTFLSWDHSFGRGGRLPIHEHLHPVLMLSGSKPPRQLDLPFPIAT